MRRWAINSAILLFVIFVYLQFASSPLRDSLLHDTLLKPNLLPPTTTILITGLVDDITLINASILEQINSYCSNHPSHITFTLLYRTGPPVPFLPLPSCSHLHVVQESPHHRPSSASNNNNLTGIKFLGNWKNRFEKMGQIRSNQRSELSSLFSTSTDVVVNIDLDVVSLPSFDSLATAIVSASGSNSIVCANGYETWLNLRHYYDTFASIDSSGNWLYYSMTNLNAILTLAQNKFYNKISRRSSNYQMHSCFGGLAVYDGKTWFDERCDYTAHHNEFQLDGRYKNGQGFACEHVVFQQCLKNVLDANISIQPDLLISRADSPFNQPIFVRIVLVVVLVVLGGLRFYIHRRQPVWVSGRKSSDPFVEEVVKRS